MILRAFRLRPALLFGVVFEVVVLFSEYAHEWFGKSGVYATAFLSGLADVDAMTITLSKFAADGTISMQVATTGIVIAAIANTFGKAALAWLLGTYRLGRHVSIVVSVVVVSGLVLLVI